MHISPARRSGRPVSLLLLLTATASAAFFALVGSAGATFAPQGPLTRTVALDTVATNGQVRAVAVSGNTAYIGGSFTVVGTPSGSAVSLDPTTAAQPGTWPRSNGSVLASVADGSGGWYIGGNFTVVGGARHEGLAHITSAGAVDPDFTASTGGPVQALYLSGSTLYIGGNFTRVDSSTRTNAAAVNATTGAVLSFNPQPNSQVSAITGSGSDIYLAGYFNTLAGGATTRNSLAAVDATTGVASSWDPNLDNGVNALVLSGTTLYAGGSFTTVNNGATTRNHVAAFSTTTGTATAWNPDVSSTVYALVLSGATVYAGGDFTSVNQGTTPATRNHIAAFDAAGVVTSFDPNLDNGVTGLALSGTTLFAAGYFTTVNGGTVRGYAAAFDTTVATANVVAWNPAPGSQARTVAVGGGRVLLGGFFHVIGGSTRNHIAAIDLTTGALTGFNPNVNDTIYSIVAGASTLYIGGSFTSVNGGTVRNHIAELSQSTGIATTFDPNVDNTVSALALQGSTLYAGGSFLHINGPVAESYMAAFSTATGLATGFNAGLNGAVYSIVLRGSTVYAGGSFTEVNSGTPRSYLAAFDATSGVPAAFDPEPSTSVNALALSADGSVLYAGGDFTTVNGATTRRYAAAFSTALATGNVLPFDANVTSSVEAIVVDGSNVYLAGSMDGAGSPIVSHVNLVRVNAVTGAADAWDPLLHAPNDATVYGVVLLADGNLLLVGDMDSAGTSSVYGIAVVDPGTAPAGPTPPISSAVALPNTPVSVAASKTGDASKPTVTVSAPAGAFNNQIGVTLGVSLPSTTLATPPGFKAVGTTVSIVVTGATPDRITTFAKPIEIVYTAPESDSAPQYSADGVTWVSIPQIPVGSTTLPAGQRDGWFKDAAGQIHVLTLHATYYALLIGGPAAAPAKSTALTLTFGVKRTPKRAAGGVTVFFQPSKAVTATATLSHKGKLLASVKGDVVALGTGALRIVFPKTLAKGAYRVTLTALAGSEKLLRSVPITVG